MHSFKVKFFTDLKRGSNYRFSKASTLYFVYMQSLWRETENILTLHESFPPFLLPAHIMLDVITGSFL